MGYGQALVHRCEIVRRDEKAKGVFTTVVSGDVSTVAKDVRCRFIRKSSSNTDTEGHVRIVENCKLLCPRGVDIQSGDLIYQCDMDGERISGAWTAEQPYQPSNHHLSVMLHHEEDS